MPSSKDAKPSPRPPGPAKMSTTGYTVLVTFILFFVVWAGGDHPLIVFDTNDDDDRPPVLFNGDRFLSCHIDQVAKAVFGFSCRKRSRRCAIHNGYFSHKNQAGNSFRGVDRLNAARSTTNVEYEWAQLN